MTYVSRSTFRKIVLGSAMYDLLVTAPFATPWSFAYAHARLDDINQRLGGAALPAFAPFHVLFACLLGSVVLVWSLLRISDPQQRYRRFDGLARLLWLFILPELGFCVAQWLPVAEADRHRDIQKTI